MASLLTRNVLAPPHLAQGLPTLKWFKAESKKAETYNGGRSKSAILNYIRGRIDGSSKDEL